MRPRPIATITATLILLALSGCSGSGGENSDIEPAVADKPSVAAAPPPYTVVEDTERSAQLLVADATKDSATAAIYDWIRKNVGDRKSATVQVVRTKGADTAVCTGEYYADEKTATLTTGGRVTADSWPHTAVECPDPGDL